jgi:hypothetical protein
LISSAASWFMRNDEPDRMVEAEKPEPYESVIFG